MFSIINKKTLEHLVKLARIELDAREEEKFLKDLQKILDHFKELQELNTTSIPPMTGGTTIKNVFREDNESGSTNQRAGMEAFPETQDGFLKIPPVFE